MTTLAPDTTARPEAERRQGVAVQDVTFTSQGEAMAGHLFVPQGADAAHRAPALVVTGAWMTVKEQMPDRYAREMAERGFVVMSFDFRGWGRSGGTPRQVENPQAKIADIAAATSFLASRPEVDGARVGALGVCASAGYVVHAASGSDTIRSVALVAPWLQDASLIEAVYGGPEGVAKLREQGRQAREAYQSTGEQSFVPAASLTDERAVMFKAPYYTEPDRGMIPVWRNEADPQFWEGWLTFDAMPAADGLRQPFLMVHSEAAVIPQGAHRFFGCLAGPKDELWLPDVTQFDFYDQPGPVATAADAVAGHFRSTL